MRVHRLYTVSKAMEFREKYVYRYGYRDSPQTGFEKHLKAHGGKELPDCNGCKEMKAKLGLK